MVSTRYHLLTVMAIFLSLGTGILLGGALGQQWLSEKQRSLTEQLARHYERQTAENRKLSANIEQLKRLNLLEREQIDRLLKFTLADELRGRHLIIVSADQKGANRLKQVIQWAGGSARVENSLKYFPIQPDGIILFADSFRGQLNDDVLSDLQLLYQVPVFVQTAQPKKEWAVDGVYPIYSSMSEALEQYLFLKYVQNIISPLEEVG